MAYNNSAIIKSARLDSMPLQALHSVNGLSKYNPDATSASVLPVSHFRNSLYNTNAVKMWSSGSGRGIRRQFAIDGAVGAKFFTWGPEANLHAFYGAPCYETWIGIVPDFSGSRTIEPGEQVQLSETWTVFSE